MCAPFRGPAWCPSPSPCRTTAARCVCDHFYPGHHALHHLAGSRTLLQGSSASASANAVAQATSSGNAQAAAQAIAQASSSGGNAQAAAQAVAQAAAAGGSQAQTLAQAIAQASAICECSAAGLAGGDCMRACMRSQACACHTMAMC